MKQSDQQRSVRSSRYSWETTKRALDLLHGISVEQIRRGLVAASVKASTLKSYRTECWRMLDWIWGMEQFDKNPEGGLVRPRTGLQVPPEGWRGRDMEDDFVKLGRLCKLEHFLAFVHAHAAIHPLQFKKVRSAIKIGQLMSETPIWATTEVCLTAERAAQRIGQASKGPVRRRGTLDELSLKKLIGVASATNPYLGRAMEIQAFGAFRISEVLGMTVEDIQKEGVLLFDEKRETVANTSTLRVKRTLKRLTLWKAGWRALKALHMRKEEMGEGSPNRLIFPRSLFTIREYNMIIRKVAQDNHWESHLRFDGSHVLRHAGVGLAVCEFASRKVSLSSMGRTLHMSERMLTFYALSNQERLSKIYIPQVLRDQVRLTEPREDSDPATLSDSDSGSDPEIPADRPLMRGSPERRGGRIRRPTVRKRWSPPTHFEFDPSERGARYQARRARRGIQAADAL